MQDVHSKNVCIFTKDAVFTGDTLLKNTKIPLTFPKSNRNDCANSVKKLCAERGIN